MSHKSLSPVTASAATDKPVLRGDRNFELQASSFKTWLDVPVRSLAAHANSFQRNKNAVSGGRLQACRCDRISPGGLRYNKSTVRTQSYSSELGKRVMVSNALCMYVCMYGTVNSITVDMMHVARQVTSTNVEVALTFQEIISSNSSQ